MSSDIAISGGFTVSRVSKAGKVQTRSILGVLSSGNREERDALVQRMVSTLIPNNSFGMVMQELCRVFPASSLAVKPKKGEKAPVGSFVANGAELWIVDSNVTMRQFDPSKCDTETVKALCTAVVAKFGPKENKGEKATYLNVARACLEHFEAKDAEKAAAEAAQRLAQDLVNAGEE